MGLVELIINSMVGLNIFILACLIRLWLHSQTFILSCAMHRCILSSFLFWQMFFTLFFSFYHIYCARGTIPKLHIKAKGGSVARADLNKAQIKPNDLWLWEPWKSHFPATWWWQLNGPGCYRHTPQYCPKNIKQVISQGEELATKSAWAGNKANKRRKERTSRERGNHILKEHCQPDGGRMGNSGGLGQWFRWKDGVRLQLWARGDCLLAKLHGVMDPDPISDLYAHN